MADTRHDRTIEDPLSTRLKERRLALRLSRLAVATAVGVVEGTVCGWEDGTSRPSSLLKWCLWAKAVDAVLEFKLSIPNDDIYVWPTGDQQ